MIRGRDIWVDLRASLSGEVSQWQEGGRQMEADDETMLGFTAHGEGFRYYSSCSENFLESFWKEIRRSGFPAVVQWDQRCLRCTRSQVWSLALAQWLKDGVATAAWICSLARQSICCRAAERERKKKRRKGRREKGRKERKRERKKEKEGGREEGRKKGRKEGRKKEKKREKERERNEGRKKEIQSFNNHFLHSPLSVFSYQPNGQWWAVLWTLLLMAF